MRILQATPFFEPSVGGVETAVRESTRRLLERGLDVEVVTGDVSRRLARKDVLHGARVQRVPAWPRGADQVFAPGVMPVVLRGGWDVVHVQGYQSMFSPMAMAAAARARIPYVLTFHAGGHSSRVRNAVRPYQLRMLRPLFARASALIATADWEIDRYSELLRLPRARFVTSPNGCDLPPVSPRSRTDGTLIMSLGRLERYKGHHHAIAALPHVLRELPDARLWIAGAGPYEADLAKLAARLGVSERVEIRAERDRPAYAAHLASADAAVLLSEFETHPMAAIEAIALGVPMLVADDRAGLAELAQKGLAQAVALDAGPAAHAAQLVKLVRRPPPPSDVELPSWDDVADELVTVYEDVARVS